MPLAFRSNSNTVRFLSGRLVDLSPPDAYDVVRILSIWRGALDHLRLLITLDRLDRALSRYFRKHLTDLPITSSQALVLEYIMHASPDHNVYQRELEEYLGIKGSSVSSLVDGLVSRGFVQREEVPDDGRCRKLLPTQAAQDLNESLRTRLQVCANEVFDGISEEEIAVFAQVVARMTGNLT